VLAEIAGRPNFLCVVPAFESEPSHSGGMSKGEFKQSPHPVHPMITREMAGQILEQHGEKKLREVLEKREEIIRLEEADPYRFGFEPDHWQHARELVKKSDELAIFGGNRSGKTEFCAKMTVEKMLEIPKARVWCFHTTHQSSLQVQQPAVYKYLPVEYRNIKKSKVTNVSYTQKNGFSDNTFVLPNSSQCTFLNYAQNRQVIEGNEVDMVWVDEFCPADWLETLRFRTATRQGNILISFTPIEGYTMMVKDLLSGHQVLHWEESELLPGQNFDDGPKGTMPYISKLRRPQAHAIWFFSKWNPYSPYKELVKRVDGSSTGDIKIRAYGWADATIGNAFPRFGEEHIIEPDKIPDGGINIMAADPAGSRNWFMLWAKKVKDTIYIYREWPDYSYGEWTVPSAKHDGSPGPAQRAGAGLSLVQYKRLIRELEGEEKIIMRLMDPRAATTPHDGIGSDYIGVMAEDKEGEGPMYFDKGSGRPIEEGVGMINDLLYWDKEEPGDAPKLMISSECKSLIYSLREWTGADKDKGASKDPVDCLRYLVQEDQLLVNERQLEVKRGGSY